MIIINLAHRLIDFFFYSQKNSAKYESLSEKFQIHFRGSSFINQCLLSPHMIHSISLHQSWMTWRSNVYIIIYERVQNIHYLTQKDRRHHDFVYAVLLRNICVFFPMFRHWHFNDKLSVLEFLEYSYYNCKIEKVVYKHFF